MSEHYPRIRVYNQHHYLLLREGLSINFHMRHSHRDVARAVVRSMETYLHAVGPHAIGYYFDEEGEAQDFDANEWERTQRELLERRIVFVHLTDAAPGEHRYRVEYQGRPLDEEALRTAPGTVCALSFRLPTEYLEEHGPGRVRELALQLAEPLPFCSGHAGLSFNGVGTYGDAEAAWQRCFRYPGFDIPLMDELSLELGTRVRGAAWLSFLGQPILGELGGAAGLRARLHSPGTTVQEMERERAVVTLGLWPEAGDTEQGRVLPAYRELARVLEPWLFHEQALPGAPYTPEDLRRWERRFLD